MTTTEGLDLERAQRERPALDRIVSGAQTGADRGGLDAAIELGIPHGGWVPRGRRAEHGVIPERYEVRETKSTDYAERTRLNVRDSDGTLVFTRGAPTGGSALTVQHAETTGHPVLHVDLEALDRSEAATRIRAWIAEHRVCVLNVAGSRESGAPGIAEEVRGILVALLNG